MARRANIIPGFGLTMGYTMFYVGLLVILPLGGLFVKTAQLSWHDFWAVTTKDVVLSAYRVSFLSSFLAAAINAVFGLIVAWVLVRYPFPGRRVVDALVDFPFALPTAVAGLTFANLYSNVGWMGRLGDNVRWGINVALEKVGLGWRLADGALSWLAFPYTSTFSGIVIVLVFVGLPFVVRTVQPVLQDLSADEEEAAASLGAGPWYTFRRVIFPALLPAWLSGLALAFARAVGEYGSVIFIAANRPGESEIAPVQIIASLHGNDDMVLGTRQATAISIVLLLASLSVLVLINGIHWWARRREGRG